MIQLNLNHCETAQQLLWQFIAEKDCDVAILSDPYRVPAGNGNWISDRTKSVAIWATGQYPIQEAVSSAEEDGFVIAKINGIYFCSVYAPPRWTLDRFVQTLDKILDKLSGLNPVVVAGDFNAWSTQWGSRTTNTRGLNLLEALARLNVELANVGDVSTFRRNGVSSIIDVTFCSPSLLSNMDWRVDEGHTNSDHQAVCYSINHGSRGTLRPAPSSTRGWKTAQFNRELFLEVLRRERNTLDLSSDELMAVLTRACDASMQRKMQGKGKRSPVYWWSETIADLRSACHRARRRFQRARTTEQREIRREAYKAAKATLGKAIKGSKKECFQNLCQDANTTPWGDAYRIVMARMKGGSTPIDRSPEMMSKIIQGLFPHHERTPWPPTPYVIEAPADETRITVEELLAAAKSLKTNKAPGPDGITNQVLKVAIKENPNMFRSTLQGCMDTGLFPDRWKRQKLVLLPKPGKPHGDPSAYRPICLIDTVGKLLEKVILNRLTLYTEGANGLSGSQFGFRKGKSTVDAINVVLETAKIAVEKKRRGYRYCAIVTLDVKNAFNSASWEAIAASLHKLKVPDYLCRILGSYFENRELLFETDDGAESIIITAGVPQGSLLGPALWNGMYDGVLRLKLPEGVQIVGFADDIVLMVLGQSQLEVEVQASEAISIIERWMGERKLSLAHQKTEVTMVCNRQSVQLAHIRAGNVTIESKRSIRYLGVMIDDRLLFSSHVNYACDKASKAVASLSRMMANNSAVSSSKRKLIASVVSSILRYGGPNWGTALDKQCNLQKMSSIYRLMCLRVASAYRTVSAEAVCVLANMVPIGLLIQEDTACYAQRGVKGVRQLARNTTLEHWQREWDNSANGRWTHRLIPDINVWVNRKHGETNFYLVQVLSGHGCFRQYLHRFGHASSPNCPECEIAAETPEHVIFDCRRFEEERANLAAACDGDIRPENLVANMCKNESTWNEACSCITQIVLKLQQRWRMESRDAVQGGS